MQTSRRQFLHATTSALLASALPQEQSAWGQTASVSDDPPIVSVRHLGNQFLDNPVGVTGADGATSTVLPSGDSLWLFGDTVEGPFETNHGLDLTPFRSNTAAIVPQQNASNGIKRFRFLAEPNSRRPRQIVPFAPDEDPAIHRVWGIHGVSPGRHVYLFYHRITLLKGVDVFVNFKLDGMGIARANALDLRFERLMAPDGSREFWKADQPTFGVFVEKADDYLYLWGSLATGMYLARTRPDTIEDLAAYEYLVEAPSITRPDAKPRWSKTFEPSAALFDSVPNEMSAAYNHYLKKHVAFHSLHRENKIVIRTAPQITGPWNGAEVVYRPERIKETDLIYAAKEHPELARDGGRILYVTYVNSSTYVPQLVELTLR